MVVNGVVSSQGFLANDLDLVLTVGDKTVRVTSDEEGSFKFLFKMLIRYDKTYEGTITNTETLKFLASSTPIEIKPPVFSLSVPLELKKTPPFDEMWHRNYM